MQIIVDTYASTTVYILHKTIKTTAVFDSWMDGLKDRQAVARIRIRLDRLAMGTPGQHRNLKAGVSELKIDFGAGYRVYYTERDGEIVILLCGGTKKARARISVWQRKWQRNCDGYRTESL